MFVVPNNPDAGTPVNLANCIKMEKKIATSSYAGTIFQIVFSVAEHLQHVWKYTTELERDSAWDDICSSTYVRKVGPASVTTANT